MEKELDYPGVFVRVKATIIDSFIMILLLLGATDVFSNIENVPDYAKIITFSCIFLLYDPLMISFMGATIGHRINKIKVQRFDNGKKINIALALIRFVIKALLGWVSLITISSNEKKQAIHDAIVNSIVVYDDRYL